MNSKLRKHPIGQVLSYAAIDGTPPKPPELEALRLPAAARGRLAKAAADVAKLRASGENQNARSLAEEEGHAILDTLTAELQDPDYLTEPEPEPTDPRELASRITRW